MQLMRQFWDAAGALDPRARELDEGVRFPLCRPEPLHALFTGAGLAGVQVRPIDVPTRFRDFDDYWTPFLGGQAPAPGYAMSLTEDRRAQLRELIRTRLPYDADGSIPLVARAWAVRGARQHGVGRRPPNAVTSQIGCASPHSGTSWSRLRWRCSPGDAPPLDVAHGRLL